MTFAESLALPYPLLSDYPDLKVVRQYGVIQHFPGIPSQLLAQRAFFLIDQQGIVRGRWLARGDEVFPNAPILQRAQEIVGK